jgi:hypothetical protein
MSAKKANPEQQALGVTEIARTVCDESIAYIYRRSDPESDTRAESW